MITGLRYRDKRRPRIRHSCDVRNGLIGDWQGNVNVALGSAADSRIAVRRMAASGRFLPVATLSPDRLVIGESGHWDASSKSHVYDIRERQQKGRKRTLDPETSIAFA